MKWPINYLWATLFQNIRSSPGRDKLRHFGMPTKAAVSAALLNRDAIRVQANKAVIKYSVHQNAASSLSISSVICFKVYISAHHAGHRVITFGVTNIDDASPISLMPYVMRKLYVCWPPESTLLVGGIKATFSISTKWRENTIVTAAARKISIFNALIAGS